MLGDQQPIQPHIWHFCLEIGPAPHPMHQALSFGNGGQPFKVRAVLIPRKRE
jgi:hypothetical protein